MAIDDYNNLPNELTSSIRFLENFTNGRVRMISTGTDRNEIIIKG